MYGHIHSTLGQKQQSQQPTYVQTMQQLRAAVETFVGFQGYQKKSQKPNAEKLHEGAVYVTALCARTQNSGACSRPSRHRLIPVHSCV